MQADAQIWIVAAGIFLAVSALTAVAGFYVENQRKIQARLTNGSYGATREDRDGLNFAASVAERVDETLASFQDPANRTKLRSELVRAGFFSPRAPAVFFGAQVMLTIAAPVIGYLVILLFFPTTSGGLEAFYLMILTFLGYMAPEAYVKRRQTQLLDQYRIVFPDFLDLLVVCIDAGLSLNAALDRVSSEFVTQCPPLANNLAILLSEVRSGRAFQDALQNLSDRLGIEEARSFNTLIKQSIELGSDIATALRVYADEMRTKRLLRAELLANALPVKMLLPLGAFIFPVLLLVVISPAILSFIKMVSGLTRG